DMTGTWTSRTVTGGLFDPQTAPADDADNVLRTVAAQLTSGAEADPRPALDALGAGFIVLTDPAGTETTLAGGIDAAPGMASVGHSSAGWLWRALPADTEHQDDDATLTGRVVLTQHVSSKARGSANAWPRFLDYGATEYI